MRHISVKILGIILAATLISPLSNAMEETSSLIDTKHTHHDMNATALTTQDVNSSSLCAVELQPVAKTIFQAVAPNVHADTNLRKLVKKNVKRKVFSGQISIKSARKNAQAASVCLSLLKMENGTLNTPH